MTEQVWRSGVSEKQKPEESLANSLSVTDGGVPIIRIYTGSFRPFGETQDFPKNRPKDESANPKRKKIVVPDRLLIIWGNCKNPTKF